MRLFEIRGSLDTRNLSRCFKLSWIFLTRWGVLWRYFNIPWIIFEIDFSLLFHDHLEFFKYSLNLFLVFLRRMRVQWKPLWRFFLIEFKEILEKPLKISGGFSAADVHISFELTCSSEREMFFFKAHKRRKGEKATESQRGEKEREREAYAEECGGHRSGRWYHTTAGLSCPRACKMRLELSSRKMGLQRKRKL